MVALYTVWYNFARINSAVKTSPAMAAGIADRVWTMADVVGLLEAEEAARPRARGSYKPRISA
jgi:hypothetical protein